MTSQTNHCPTCGQYVPTTEDYEKMAREIDCDLQPLIHNWMDTMDRQVEQVDQIFDNAILKIKATMTR